MKMRLWPLFLFAAVLLALTGQAHAALKGELLGTIATSAIDTTASINVQNYNAAHLILTWAGEDSVKVTPQLSPDGGSTWIVHPIFTATSIDGGTSPYAYLRDLGFLPADGSGEAVSGICGTHMRFIVENEGSTSATSVKVLLHLEE